jgi:hypothetical protein
MSRGVAFELPRNELRSAVVGMKQPTRPVTRHTTAAPYAVFCFNNEAARWRKGASAV